MITLYTKKQKIRAPAVVAASVGIVMPYVIGGVIISAIIIAIAGIITAIVVVAINKYG